MPIPAQTPSSTPGALAVTLEAESAENAPSGVVVARPNHPHAKTWYPGNWEVVAEGFGDGAAKVVPILGTHSLAPGVCGVVPRKDIHKRPQDRYDNAVRNVSREGGIWIDPYEHNLIASVPCKTRQGLPGKLYFDRFCRPRVSRSNGLVYDRDLAAYNRWRRSLVDDGIIPKPEADELEVLAEQVETKIARLRVHQQLSPEQKAQRIMEAEAELATIRKAIDAELGRTAPAEPAPMSARDLAAAIEAGHLDADLDKLEDDNRKTVASAVEARRQAIAEGVA